MKSSAEAPKIRYSLIDAARGFSIINMAAFHLLYDLFVIYGLNTEWSGTALTAAWEKFICISFILISGISLNFSRRTVKRGIELNLLGLLVTAVTAAAMPDEAIWFGILNLLGCSALICYPLEKFFGRVNPAAGTAACLLLFAVLYGVPGGYIGFFGLELLKLPDFLYNSGFMFFLGFPSESFASSDYFPLIPWIFLFAAGYFLWKSVLAAGVEKYFLTRVPVLDFIGRHSLLIYLAHQPIFIGICIVIFGR